MIILGRIKTKDIKSAAKDVIKQNPQAFTTDFESNKAQVNKLGFQQLSKRVRNKMAGYITRRKKIEASGPRTSYRRAPARGEDKF